MQMTVELTEEQVRRLDEKGAAENSSREEVVGRAVNAYVGLEHSTEEEHRLKAIHDAFGLWKDRGEDTFGYLRRIRGE